VRIPYGEANCIKVPEGVYDEDALYLSDSLCVPSPPLSFPRPFSRS